MIDAQLPPALVKYLQARGHDAEHVNQVGLREADDALILGFAAKHQSVLLTKDEDFFWIAQGMAQAPQIVWLRMGNTNNRGLLHVLDQVFNELLEAIRAGDPIIEIN